MIDPGTLDCSRCGAKPGAPCVYVISPLANESWTPNQGQLERAGRPTKRFHNQRFGAAYRAEKIEARREEFRRLRDWFLAHGSIFQ